jgi:hypothetical protein
MTRTLEDRENDLAVGRLIEAYDRYIELLGESEASMIGLAWAHGWRTTDAMIAKAMTLRRRIDELKQSVLATANGQTAGRNDA